MEEYIVVLSPKRWEVNGAKGSRRRKKMGIGQPRYEWDTMTETDKRRTNGQPRVTKYKMTGETPEVRSDKRRREEREEEKEKKAKTDKKEKEKKKEKK